MSAAKSGDSVKVHYTGSLSDGTVFDSSEGRDPLQFMLGSGSVIPGFDSAVNGMAVGESKTVTIPHDQAYGPRHAHLTQEVPRSAMPDDVELAPGLILQARDPQGETLNFTVVEFDNDNVKVDGNHPLAGKDLTFVVELVAIG